MPLQDADVGEFSFANLAILLVVAVLIVPGYLKLRVALSRSRRERWARQEAAYRDSVEGQDRQDGTERSV